jgi:hypothetical protein
MTAAAFPDLSFARQGDPVGRAAGGAVDQVGIGHSRHLQKMVNLEKTVDPRRTRSYTKNSKAYKLIEDHQQD